ncbi:MAG: hypothetical protein JRH06_01430 [Deltaproteobacteria bacterium]|nr:hypothetical protein [Deltaproteobacteria bacterium]MBW2136202.1 hypothetical protein [Deltaproteobacteria bacterium]
MDATPSVKETEDLGRLIRSFRENHSISSEDKAVNDLQRNLKEVTGQLKRLAQKMEGMEARMQHLEEVIKLLFKKSVIMNESIESIKEEVSQGVRGRS